jgi:hypothetical protein
MAVLGASAVTLATLTSAVGADTTVSGKLVDVAKWVSNDSTSMMLNMPDIMMSSMSDMMSGSSAMTPGTGSAMSAHHASGESMTGSGMSMGSGSTGGMMQNCHATLGIVTSNGDLYVLLANQASPMGALGLCSRVGQQVTVTGTTYARGGIRALLVSGLRG